ncbi:MAG: 3-dehydroquinate synthase [Verrucomicrobiales bacterium]
MSESEPLATNAEWTRSFEVRYTHRVFFTRRAADPTNPVLDSAIGDVRRVLVVIEDTVHAAHPDYAPALIRRMGPRAVPTPLVLSGGEQSKQDTRVYDAITRAIHECGIDRHSVLVAVGGGAFLDAAGFAAATAHRGVQLVRFPTTTLAQADSGVGVKNSLNTFGKKNFTGSFSVPLAIVNDLGFLSTQNTEQRILGLIEALKVALIKDPELFTWIAENVGRIRSADTDALEFAVRSSARLHFDHITLGSDPFERGSSRPLDFGHWAAHKLESLSGHSLSHAGAVSIGLALDVTYSFLKGWLPEADARAIFRVFHELSWPVYHPLLEAPGTSGNAAIYDGLDEFREHLGGELTLLMLDGIGRPRDIHEVDFATMTKAIAMLARSAKFGTSIGETEPGS